MFTGVEQVVYNERKRPERLLAPTVKENGS